MSAPRPDPYRTLGVTADASDDEVRAAYRRLVQLHHPDHNAGSAQATRRFEEIQEAYGQITELRKLGPGVERPQSPPTDDPHLEARIAEIERQVREAYAARERARRAAREAAEQTERHPSDEELGYFSTEDSLSKLLADARSEIAERFTAAGRHPAATRLDELIDDIAAKLRGEGRGRSPGQR